MTTTTRKGSESARKAKIESLYQATKDPRGFFESVLGFEDLAGRWFRVSSADQQYYFGDVPFGKCAIKVTEEYITLFKSKAFGKDYDTLVVRYDFSAKRWLYAGSDQPLARSPHFCL